MIDRCHLTSYIQKFSWRFHEGNICFKRLHALHLHQGKVSTRTIAGSVVASGATAAALVAAAGSGTFSLFQNDGWLVVINHSVGICSLLVSTYSQAGM